MAYTKQNFADGQVLKAEHLNHIEEGLSKAAVAYENRVEVLAETTLEINVDEGSESALILDVLDVIAGDKCVVTYNGIEYECEAGLFEAEGQVATTLGDVGYVTGGEVSGEYPFAMMIYTAEFANAMGAGATVIAIDGSASVTISIYKNDIHPIDGKYLPNGTPWIEEGGMAELPVTGEWVDEDGAAFFMGTAPIGLTVGKTYIVNWGGVEYEVVAEDMSAMMEGLPCVGMGNITWDENGVPFQIAEFGEEAAAMIGSYVAANGLDYAETEFSIYRDGTTFHKIDSRCLPDSMVDGMPSLFNVNFTAENTSATTATIDKTFVEVFKNALNANTIVRGICKLAGGASTLMFDVSMITNSYVLFNATGYIDGFKVVYAIKLSADGTCTFEQMAAI